MKKSIFLLIIITSFMFCSAYEGEETLFTMGNGLTVILRETHNIPMISMVAHVKAGSLTEGKRMGMGVSHYFEHMLFKGTKKRGPGEIPQTIHLAGGSDMNAYTSFEKTVYHFTVLSQYKDTGLDVLSDMLLNSVFDQEEAEKEQKVILKEINMKDDEPDSQLYWGLMDLSFKVFPYYMPVIGYENLFRKLTRDDIEDYYNTMYSPSNTVLSFVGDFDTDKMKEDIERYFGSWERKAIDPVVLPEEPAQTAFRYMKKESDVQIPKFMMGYHTISITDPDLFAMDCLSSILGGGKTSRLYKRIVEKEKLAYEIFASSWTPQYPGLLLIKSTFEEKNFTALKFAVLDEINRFKYEKVSESELEEVKNIVKAYSIYSKENIMSQAESLIDSFVNSGTLDFDRKYLEGISKVTPDDIVRVARKYLGYNNLSMYHMVPRTQKTEITSEKNEKTASVRQSVEKIVLDNGVTVLLKEDRKLPMISVNAGFHGGVLVENEKNNGISSLLSKLLVTSSKKYSKEQVLDIQRKTGSSIGGSSGNNTVFMNMRCLSENFDSIWDIYTDLMINNRMEAGELEKEKEKVIAGIKQQMEDINYVNGDIYRKAMFKGHPYSMDKSGTIDTVSSIDRSVLQDFYRKVIVPSNMTIAVTGDFDMDRMKQKVIRTLEGFNGPEFRKPEINRPVDISGVDTIVRNMPGKKQSIIRLAFEGPDNRNNDRFVMSVISNIMSGLGSRLFEELRSKHSLAYSVGGYPFAGIQAGSFFFYIATVPEKRDFAVKMLHQEIEKIKKAYVTDEELERAKNKIIGSLSADMQSTLGVCEDLVLNEMYGYGYDFTREYIDEISKITREDVKKVANRYFGNDYRILVVEP